ncbi:MAG: S1 RNA-binding domain-containing protein [Acutalibacteraceae bacterium]|nr:S1 RNA-binding domain-containing protein [Acutalibacteraceae bacterium]
MQIVKDSVLEAKITGITKFGVFVEIEKGLSGLVHISEVSNSFVQDINDIYSVGDKVKVKVIDCSDPKKISLSIKQTQEPLNNQKKAKNENFNTFKGIKKSAEPQSFEDMMAKFKQSSEEKFSQLKHKNSETRRPRRSSK